MLTVPRISPQRTTGAVVVLSIVVATAAHGPAARPIDTERSTGRPAAEDVGVVGSEFVFETAPFASAHASTIVETGDGLVAAWFGGTREGADDVGIWLSRRVDVGRPFQGRQESTQGRRESRWTSPVEVANGVDARLKPSRLRSSAKPASFGEARRPASAKATAVRRSFSEGGSAFGAPAARDNAPRYPCWNPVLYEMPDRTLSLFYKVGPSPQQWWGMVRTSRDHARTWSPARRLPDGILGPIKNKAVRLSDGTVISPSSTESTDRPSTWRVHFERSVDGGRTWDAGAPPASGDGSEIHAIQPSILVHPDGRLQAVGRTRSRRIFETWSSDRGKTWTPIALTVLPNPNSGIDAVTLRDGRHLIVYNHTIDGRSPLNVAVSRDGTAWGAALVLEREPGEYSYPAVIQTADALVHITYTWRRQRIKHITIDPAKLSPVPMPDGTWPASVR